jgi:hypothetical protein
MAIDGFAPPRQAPKIMAMTQKIAAILQNIDDRNNFDDRSDEITAGVPGALVGPALTNHKDKDMPA